MPDEPTKSVSVPDSVVLSRILARLDRVERQVLEDIIGSMRRPAAPRIEDIWDSIGLPSSHWLLVMTGIDHEDELTIATELLQWREFSARGSARIACVPSSDRPLYNLVTSTFAITKCPALVISNSPNMASAIKIEAPLLSLLVSKRGNLRKVLNEVHTLIEQGTSLADIARRFRKEDLLEKVKLAYTEAKSLLSITVTTET